MTSAVAQSVYLCFTQVPYINQTKSTIYALLIKLMINETAFYYFLGSSVADPKKNAHPGKREANKIVRKLHFILLLCENFTKPLLLFLQLKSYWV